ncbi:hypothetical protein Tco_1227536 [Tanacetum coccineum]
MRAIHGALIIASTIQIILGFSGLWRNVARMLSPLSVLPLVALAGLGSINLDSQGLLSALKLSCLSSSSYLFFLRIRAPYPFQWGALSFHAGEAFAMMMAAFVALVESTCSFITVSRYASTTPLPPSILGQGVGWQFNNIVNVPFSPEAFVAAIVAFLDNKLDYKDKSIRKDRGKHWWDKFRSFKTDSKSEEFYSLPFKLNKYFPSV